MSEASIQILYVFEFVTAIGVIYAILRGVRSDTKSRNQDFAKMLGDYDKELFLVLDREKELETGKPKLASCERIATDYLNILDRIAFLRKLKKIDDDMIFYFDNYFAYGKLFIEWKFNVLKHKEKTKKRFENHVWWTETSFNKHRLKEYNLSDLPKDMEKLYKQNIQNKQKTKSTHGVMPKGWKPS